MVSPPAKRRRSESSTNHQQLPVQSSEVTTLTLDQLKVQYGNVSVSILNKLLSHFICIMNIAVIGRSIEEASSYD